MKPVNVAVVGATGAVGEAMIEILESREFPVDTLYPLASNRSAGKSVKFCGKHHTVQDLSTFDFSQTPIGLFSAGGDISAEYAPIAASAGCVVIDNTSHFRRDKDIPLVIPEVNPEAIADYRSRGIIANPNCSTIGMLVALKPLCDAVGIERINVATYQAVSGTGKAAIEELAGQTARLLNGKAPEPEVYPKQIAFNAIPHIDIFSDDGYTKEELKMTNETKKILDSKIDLTATCVRLPISVSHSESVNLQFEKPFSLEKIKEALNNFEGCKVVDERVDGGYSTPLEAEGKDETFISRIREDKTIENGLNLWIVSDNLLRGAALNAVEIAETLIKNNFYAK